MPSDAINQIHDLIDYFWPSDERLEGMEPEDQIAELQRNLHAVTYFAAGLMAAGQVTQETITSLLNSAKTVKQGQDAAKQRRIR